MDETKRPLREDVLCGRNAVEEALKAGRNLDCIYVAKGQRQGSVVALLAKAKKLGISVKEADSRKLDALCGGENHQGVVAVGAVKAFATLEDVFALAEKRGEPPFLLLLDEINDPHNLGAMLRTAECTGVHGVIIPKRRSVGLTYAVGKSSAGAVEYVPVVRVSNLVQTAKELKERGVWLYAADMNGTPWCTVDYSGGVGLIIGNEGEGISRLLKEQTDFTVSLPMQGQIQSLNASVACGVLCYEIARQRAKLPSK